MAIASSPIMTRLLSDRPVPDVTKDTESLEWTMSAVGISRPWCLANESRGVGGDTLSRREQMDGQPNRTMRQAYGVTDRTAIRIFEGLRQCQPLPLPEVPNAR
jgi:hypothetical protein